MKVAIYTDKDNYGYVFYNEHDHSIMVTHPDRLVRQTIYRYLTTPKEFTVPASNRMGDRAFIERKPCESISLLEMGLCEMYHSIGVHVSWDDPDNEGSSTIEIPESTPNTNADKPLLKSIENDDYFEIIN